MCKLQGLLGMDLRTLRAWIVLKNHLLWWVVSCGRMTSAKDYIVDVWKLWKARLYDENLSVPQSQCQNSSGELRDVEDGGTLKCLHG